MIFLEIEKEEAKLLTKLIDTKVEDNIDRIEKEVEEVETRKRLAREIYMLRRIKEVIEQE